jgi:hypothetical protein
MSMLGIFYESELAITHLWSKIFSLAFLKTHAKKAVEISIIYPLFVQKLKNHLNGEIFHSENWKMHSIPLHLLSAAVTNKNAGIKQLCAIE